MNSVILFFSAVAFLFMFGFGIALPSLPLIILNLGYTEVEAGLVISSWAITYVTFSVIAGFLVEKVGANYALPLGLIGNSIIALIYIFGNIFPCFIFGRMLQGIFESLIWVSVYGSIAALFPQAKIKSLGIVSASSILGFSLGLFSNSFLVAIFNLKFTFLPYLFISLLCAVMTYVRMASFNLKVTAKTQIENPLKLMREINLSAALIMAMAFFVGCFDGVFQANSDKIAEISGFPSTFGGVFLSVYYISLLLSQYTLAMLRRDFSKPGYTTFTFTLASILFCFVAVIPFKYPLSLIIWVIVGFIIGTNVIIFMSHITDALRSKSMAMGLYQASWGCGYMVFPPLAGFMFRMPLFANIYVILLTLIIANALISTIRLIKIKSKI